MKLTLQTILLALFLVTETAGADTVINLHPVIGIEENEYRVPLKRLARILAAPETIRQHYENIPIVLPKRLIAAVGATAETRELLASINTALVADATWDGRLVGAPSVRVVRIDRYQDAASLIKLAENSLLNWLEQHTLQASVRYLGSDQVRVPEGAAIGVRVESQALSTRMCVWLDVRDEDTLAASIPLWFAVDAEIFAYLIANDVKAGTIFKNQVIVKQRVSLSALRGKPVVDLLAWEDTRFKHDLPAQSVLVEELLQPVPAVHYGQKVQVKSTFGKIAVVTEALARSEADIGGRVQLQSLSTHEMYTGRVVDRGMVWVGHETR